MVADEITITQSIRGDRFLMRVGLIYLGRRGAGGSLGLNLAKGLYQYASVFSLLSKHSESLDAWKTSGMEYDLIPTYTNLSGVIYSLMNKTKFKKIAETIRSKKPDVLIFPMFYTWNPFIQREMTGTPSIVAVHDPIPHPGILSQFYRLLEDRSIRQADRCLIFSEGLLNAMETRGVPKNLIDVIPLGTLNHSSGSPIKKDEDLAQKTSTNQKTTLLFFGRITAYKGLDILLKAYSQISNRTDLNMIIAGSGSLLRYNTIIKELPNIEVINRWINEHDIQELFERADIVVLPYTSASQSGVIALAASHGLPVISTHTGGISEQITDGQNGLLVTPGSIAELRDAIIKLLNSPEDARRLGKKLQETFQGERNWEKIAALVYDSCLRVTGKQG